LAAASCSRLTSRTSSRAELVAEPAVGDARVEDGAGPREAVREADLLVVREEERLVPSVVEARNARSARRRARRTDSASPGSCAGG
jgi:hypothetical protein